MGYVPVQQRRQLMWAVIQGVKETLRDYAKLNKEERKEKLAFLSANLKTVDTRTDSIKGFVSDPLKGEAPASLKSFGDVSSFLKEREAFTKEYNKVQENLKETKAFLDKTYASWSPSKRATILQSYTVELTSLPCFER